MPNGLVASYAYDDASQVTAITYTAGATTVGDLAYSYDSAGHRAQVSGSLVRSSLPAAVTTSTYDAADRLTSISQAATSVAFD